MFKSLVIFIKSRKNLSKKVSNKQMSSNKEKNHDRSKIEFLSKWFWSAVGLLRFGWTVRQDLEISEISSLSETAQIELIVVVVLWSLLWRGVRFETEISQLIQMIQMIQINQLILRWKKVFCRVSQESGTFGQLAQIGQTASWISGSFSSASLRFGYL